MTGITHQHLAADRRHVLALVLAGAAVAAVALVLALAWAGGDTAPTAAPVFGEAPAQTLEIVPNAPRYDGGPDEGTRGPGTQTAPNPGRPDGGPDEGTVGPGH